MSSKSHEYRIIVEEGSGQTSGNSSNTASRWQSLDRGFDDNRLNEVVEESERLDRWRLVCLTIGIGGYAATSHHLRISRLTGTDCK